MIGASGTPQSRIDDFYKVVGQCITEWAEIDETLFRIFRDCLHGMFIQCAVVYYRTPGLDVRLNTVDELVHSLFPKPKSGEHWPAIILTWRKLRNEIKSALSIRRRIAHHPISTIQNFLLLFTYPDKYGGADFMIEASDNERMRGKDEDQIHLGIRDLMLHFHAVKGLCEKINEFHDVLQEHIAEYRKQGSL